PDALPILSDGPSGPRTSVIVGLPATRPARYGRADVGSRCTIELLGGFRVTVDDRPVPPESWRRRGADLVKLLALAATQRLHREQVIDALWPDLPPDQGGANLRKAIHFARRALGTEEALGTERTLVALWP